MPRAKKNGSSSTAKSAPVATPTTTPVIPINAETKKSASNPIPTNLEEAIRIRAYELYQERGATPGHEHEDWVIAEREILGRAQSQSA